MAVGALNKKKVLSRIDVPVFGKGGNSVFDTGNALVVDCGMAGIPVPGLKK